MSRADFTVGKKTVQRTYRQRLIDLAPVAGFLAGMVADSPAGSGERITVAVKLEGFIEFPLRQKSDKTMDIHSGRAGKPACRIKLLVDNECIGERLWI